MEKDNNFRSILGEIVSTARLEKGFTQKELGIQMGYTNNSAGQVIHKIEEGKIDVPKKKIHKLVDILDITNEKLGIEKSISLPIWIATRGKKGGSLSLKEFVSKAETVANSVAGISESVATGVTEITESVAAGVTEISETVASEFNSKMIHAREGVPKKLFDLVKKILVKETSDVELDAEEQLRLIQLLCKGDSKKIEKICKIIEI